MLPSLNDLSWPGTSESAILASIAFQAGRRIKGEEPPASRQESLVQDALAAYPHTTVPLWCAGEDINEDLLREVLDRIVDSQLNRSSSPGIPLKRLDSTNLSVLEANYELIIDATVQRLRLLAQCNPEEDPASLVELGLCDPVRFFVKKEPHSAEKVAQRRLRLIASVSLVDQLVERTLFTLQNKAEIADYINTPSMPGLGLTDDAQLQQIWNLVSLLSGGDLSNAAEADVSGFDWSVQAWELRLDGRMRIALMGAKTDSLVARLINNRIKCVVNATFATSTGQLFKLAIPGIQLSGSFNTSATNSRVRWFLARLAGASWAIAMGDDCVEEFTPGAVAVYERMGHKLKMYTRCENSFSFCSHIFTKDVAHPENGDKTLFRFLSQPLDADLPGKYHQMCTEMRNSPRLGLFKEICATVVGEAL